MAQTTTITKAKILKGDRVEIEFTSRPSADAKPKTCTEESENPPRPSFKKAFDALAIHAALSGEFIPETSVADITKIDPTLVKDFTVTSFSLNDSKKNGEGVILTGHKTLSSGKILGFNSPIIRFNDESENAYPHIEELEAAIEMCKDEAAQYLNGAYADDPVLKTKPLQQKEDGTTQAYDKNTYSLPIVRKSGYSRSRWQIDAHGFTRSSGDRLLDPVELGKMNHSDIFQTFKEQSLHEIYNFEHHVSIGEELEIHGKLPSGFMLLQPQSWTDEVWTDITRMLTLNGTQWSMGKEMHICPMQFDIADRVISQMSNPGDIVYDPFAGLMTTPLRAMLLGRFGLGHELSPQYFLDGVAHCKAAERKINIPTLFDAITEAV